MFFESTFRCTLESHNFIHRKSSIPPSTMSSPASCGSTLGSTDMPMTSTPKATVTKSVTPKLTKMYQDHIDPMTEYELSQSMNRMAYSVSNSSRRPLESLDISSGSTMAFYGNYSRSTSPTSVQSWPMDNFTHQSGRHHYVAQRSEPAYHFSEFDSSASTHTLFQNRENENDVEMQSPVIQRLLNERNDDGFFSTFSTFSM